MERPTCGVKIWTKLIIHKMAAVMSIRSFNKEEFRHKENRREEEFEETCIAENLQNEERIAQSMQKKSEEKKQPVINQDKENNLGKALQRNDERKNLDVKNKFDLTQGMGNLNLMENSVKSDHENKLDSVVNDMNGLVISKKKIDGEKPKKEKKDRKNKENEKDENIDHKIKKEKKKEHDGDDNSEKKAKTKEKKNKEDKISEGDDNIEKKLTKEEKKEKKEKKNVERAEEKLKKAEKKEEKKRRKGENKKSDIELEREKRIAENDKYVISRTPFKIPEEPKSNLHNTSGGGIIKENDRNVDISVEGLKHLANDENIFALLNVISKYPNSEELLPDLNGIDIENVIRNIPDENQIAFGHRFDTGYTYGTQFVYPQDIAPHIPPFSYQAASNYGNNSNQIDLNVLQAASNYGNNSNQIDLNVLQAAPNYGNNSNQIELNGIIGPCAPQAVRLAGDSSYLPPISTLLHELNDIYSAPTLAAQSSNQPYEGELNGYYNPSNSPSISNHENRRYSFADSGIGNSPGTISNSSPTHSIASEEGYDFSQYVKYPAWDKIKRALNQDIKSKMWTCVVDEDDETFRIFDINGNTRLMDIFKSKELLPNKCSAAKFLAFTYSYGERQLKIDKKLMEQKMEPILLKKNKQNQGVIDFIKACKQNRQ